MPGVLGDEQHGGASRADARQHIVQEGRRDRDVEAAGGLVGDQQGRGGAERHGDEHALRHAAADLVRVGVHPAFRIVQPEAAQHRDGVRVRLGAGGALVGADGGADLVADGVQRAEGAAGVLGDERHVPAPDGAALAFRQGEQVRAAQEHLTGLDHAAGLHQAEDRQAERALAAARVAGEAHDGAGGDLQVQPADRGAPSERDGQSADLQRVSGHRGAPGRCRMRRSRTP